MSNALILHGRPGKEESYSATFPSASNAHWIPWLQKQLAMKDIWTQTPEMPKAYEPDYEVWRQEFERFDIGSETLLVGHSFGGGFLVRWLSEHPEINVGKVVLVAPSIDPEGERSVDFFDFEIDPALAARTTGLAVFLSDDEQHDQVKKSVAILRDKIANLKYVGFTGQGHFIYKHMQTFEFPELLEELVI